MTRYEQAYKKSCTSSKVNYKKDRMVIDKTKFKKFLITASLVIACASSALTGVVINTIDTIKDNQIVSEYIEPYYAIVSNNTHRTVDNQNYWYDVSDIADELLSDKEAFNEKFYAVYQRIGYNDSNKIKHLDQILSIVDGRLSMNPEPYDKFVGYDSFNDFLIANSFVDKEGKPSREAYEKHMNEYIIAKATMEKLSGKEEGKGF